MHNITTINNIAFIRQLTKSCNARTIIILSILKDIPHKQTDNTSVSVTLLKTTYKALRVSRHTLAD